MLMLTQPPATKTHSAKAVRTLVEQLTNELRALTPKLTEVSRRIRIVRRASKWLPRTSGMIATAALLNKELFGAVTPLRLNRWAAFRRECGSVLKNSSIPLTIGEICSELATRNLPVSKRQDPVRAVSISLHVLVQEGCAMPAEQEGIRKWVWVRVANSNATTATDHVVTIGEWDKAPSQ
jgi:hypothetical protein